jgi:hypothetical protein
METTHTQQIVQESETWSLIVEDSRWFKRKSTRNKKDCDKRQQNNNNNNNNRPVYFDPP